ncbi:MAG TPA: ECF-type sigma factor [Povalibacter sp.]|uniref:ECF-type sigma factor n=1 Tax=Povalibacter sp. TaxID=1962978 RepID=UPI002C2872AB|nr:ECF-type sigma factor [Povalibacter sp.]HMN47031.1 ECF-type sigma factor [Povalibacter sp.]
MKNPSPPPVTQLLALARAGDARALDAAYAALYEELKQAARRQLRRSTRGFETTALVHEAYLKLAGREPAAGHARHHLAALSARAMRQVLVDHARRVGASKRDAGGPTLALREGVESSGDSTPDALGILLVDETIEAIHKVDARVARVVELHCFGGYDVAEIARIMELPEYTVRRDWRKARALLLAEMCA